jgi:hypothetical protein
VKVTDDGIGFRPRSDSPGLGLPTIIALTASTALATPPSGGTQRCMAFALPGAPINH